MENTPANESGKQEKRTGIQRIADERARQIGVEGWTEEHDAKHDGGELSEAAICYADIASAQIRGAGAEELREHYLEGFGENSWPWDDEWFKPSEHAIRNLEKAGALIAAEIDRLLNRKIGEGQ